jgi:HK97 family phage major capsid protein
VYSSKISQLIRLSNELRQQSGTADQLAQSVSRALVKKADQAFVFQVAPTPPATAPSAGLLNVTNIVAGDQVTGSLDNLVDLVATLESNASIPSHIITDPFGWAELRKLKTGTDFNSSLISAGTTDATQMLLSLPVIVNREVPAYTGLVIDRRAVVSAVSPVSVAADTSVYFTSDSVALRAVAHRVQRRQA